jgi:hypothetical protein
VPWQKSIIDPSVAGITARVAGPAASGTGPKSSTAMRWADHRPADQQTASIAFVAGAPPFWRLSDR